MLSQHFHGRNFQRDEGGSVAIIFALCITLLFGAIGIAIDISRSVTVSSRLSAALDAAALAGAKKLDAGGTDAEVQQVTNNFFHSTADNLRIGEVAMAELAVQIDRATTSVTVSINASVGTMFAKVAGIGSMSVNKSATVSYQPMGIELAMALDNSGSMADNGKIDALKTAANSVINTMLVGQPNDDLVRVSIVPWSSSVNAGTLAGPASGGVSVDNCVVERTGTNAATDASPTVGGPVGAVTSTPYGSYMCPTPMVIPLTGVSKIQDLRNSITSLTPNGWTAGQIGTAWGWYMVSPEWASLVPAASQPKPYNARANIKSVLLMTDGLFNVAYLGSPPSGNEVTDSYLRFQALCDGMKANKILIYTVGLGVSDTTAISQLQACASDANKYFSAVDGTELQTVFDGIAKDLMRLRIAK